MLQFRQAEVQTGFVRLKILESSSYQPSIHTVRGWIPEYRFRSQAQVSISFDLKRRTKKSTDKENLWCNCHPISVTSTLLADGETALTPPPAMLSLG